MSTAPIAPPTVTVTFDDLTDRGSYFGFSRLTTEKQETIGQIAQEIDSIEPSSDGFRYFDCGTGTGEILAGTADTVDKLHPGLSILIVGKEVSDQDANATTARMAPRFARGSPKVLVMTNINTQGAPWLEHPNSEAAANTIWMEVALEGDTEEDFTHQIEGLNDWVSAHWTMRSRDSKGAAYKVPVVLVIYRKDQRESVAHLIPRKGERLKADYDLVIASQAYATAQEAWYKAKNVVAALLPCLKPGGKFVGIQAHEGGDAEAVLSQAIPGKRFFPRGCEDIMEATATKLGAAASQFNLHASRRVFPYGLRRQPVKAATGASPDEATCRAAWGCITYAGQVSPEISIAHEEAGLAAVADLMRHNGGEVVMNNLLFTATRHP